ncbi:hypothetical protein [Streptomyces hirsutus]|uniref:hypothetical protein n=1 Tax=Streptomyces hirsutus TaxID=35620 RepID=UPI00331D074A
MGLLITAGVSWVGILATREQIKQSQLALAQEESKQAEKISVWVNPKEPAALIVANRSPDGIANAILTVNPIKIADDFSSRRGAEGAANTIHVHFGTLAPCGQYEVTAAQLLKATHLDRSAKGVNALTFHLLEFFDSSGHPWARDSFYRLSDRESNRTDLDFSVGGEESPRVSWEQIEHMGAKVEIQPGCGDKE